MPLKVIGTAWLYQLLASASRAGVPPVTTGRVMSTLMSCSTCTVALASLALQNSVVPWVSVVNVLSWQPDKITAVDGSTVQSTNTSDRYQLEQSAGAGEHSTVTRGAACTPSAPNIITNQTTAAIAATPRARLAAASKGPSTAVRGPSRYCGWGRIN